jgi:hypothetical protein
MAGTPILPPTTQKEEKKPRQVSKGLSVKDKNKMCSILGFLLLLKETGKIDETEAKRLMEELPLYSISRIQTEYFAQDAFDLKKIEVELWKPMVVENKLDKKNKKLEKTTKPKPKKERKQKENKNSKISEPEPEQKPDDDEQLQPPSNENKPSDDEQPVKKRGRKTKKQIIEFKESSESSSASEDKLEDLFNEMLHTNNNNNNHENQNQDTDTDEEKKKNTVTVDEADLDAVLRELEVDGILVPNNQNTRRDLDLEDGELVEEQLVEEEIIIPKKPVKKNVKKTVDTTTTTTTDEKKQKKTNNKK